MYHTNLLLVQVSTTKEIKEVGMQGEKAMEVQYLYKENNLVEEILYQKDGVQAGCGELLPRELLLVL